MVLGAALPGIMLLGGAEAVPAGVSLGGPLLVALALGVLVAPVDGLADVAAWLDPGELAGAVEVPGADDCGFEADEPLLDVTAEGASACGARSLQPRGKYSAPSHARFRVQRASMSQSYFSAGALGRGRPRAKAPEALGHTARERAFLKSEFFQPFVRRNRGSSAGSRFLSPGR